MHAKTFIHKLLSGVIHKSRLTPLTQIVVAIILTKQLKLTAVGRAINVGIQERSGIRKIDRLLGNEYYQRENKIVYENITRLVVGNKKRPIILVDWAKVPNTNTYLLKAALAAEGRGITLYEEVHPKAKEGNRKVHKEFLKRLHSFLADDCKPIVVTDAGFKNPWFKDVLALGWDYVGRVRGKVQYLEGDIFKECRGLHALVGVEPRSLGEKQLTKKNPLLTYFYLATHKLKGRKKLTKGGKVSQHKDSINYSKSYREPWVLVSSLSGRVAAKKVFNIYRLRMRIEENIRDTKSTEYGLSMNENHTVNSERLIVWFLLAALASLFAWTVGYVAEEQKLQYQFQANTIRHRRVLSFVYLGFQILRKNIKIPIDLNKINYGIDEAFIDEVFA